MLMREFPPPRDWEDLERLIASYARLELQDPQARRYRRQGEAQFGVDVLAHDRRPGETTTGQRWTFQAKRVKRFGPADLRKELDKFAGFPHRVDHYVVVTSARVSAQVDDKAVEETERLGISVGVWGWEEFSERCRLAGAAGSWLPPARRESLRGMHLHRVRFDFEEARPLHPRTELDTRLADVWTPVMPELLSPPPDGAPGAAWLERWLTLDTAPLVLLTGGMGSGKTVGLLHACARLASAAADDEHPDGPLPLLLSASSLLDWDLQSAPLELVRVDPDLAALWTDPMTTWRLLVDGADEVGGPRELADLAAVCRGLLRQPRVASLAISCRSNLAQGFLPEALHLRFNPWSPTEARRFRRQWELAGGARPPSAMTSLDPGVPLFATLLAAFPEASSTAAAMEELAHVAFSKWPRERGSNSGWERHRLAFEELALSTLATETDGLGVEEHLARSIGLRSVRELLERATEELGLLSISHGGSLRWSDPLVQTWLAGCALTRQSDDDLLEAAGNDRLAEALLFAVDRLRVEAPNRLTGILKQLLHSSAPTPDRLLRWLDVAIDLARGGTSDALLDWTSDLLVDLARRESSGWLREAASGRIGRLAMASEDAWERLWGRVDAVVTHEGDRSSWLAGLDVEALTPQEWLEFLTESTPSVRAIATTRLGELDHSEDVVTALLWTLLDDGYCIRPSGTPPAIAAGRALRSVTSKELRERIRSVALPLLGAGQITGGGAAIALHPREAPVESQLHALRHLHVSIKLPIVEEAVLALRTDPAGEAWVQLNWPGAPDTVSEPPPGLHRSEAREAAPPASEAVRRELLRAVAPGLLLHDREGAPLLWRDAGLRTLLCKAGGERPEPLVAFLNSETSLWTHPEAQAAIGAAALRHEEVREALLAAWGRARFPSTYPGLALEPLIEGPESGQRAIDAYCAWLPHFPFAQPLQSVEATPSRAVLRKPPILETAGRWADELWVKGTGGWTDAAGDQRVLHELTLGRLLGALGPAWESNDRIRDGLLARAMKGERQWLGAALEAWRYEPAPADLVEIAAARLRLIWPPSSGAEAWEIVILLAAFERLGTTAEVINVALKIVEDEWPTGLPRAARLLARRSGEFSSMSELVASNWPRGDPAGVLEESEFLDLIGAAPGAWAARLQSVLDAQGPLCAAPALAVLRQLVRVDLDGRALARVESVLQWLEHRPLLWVRRARSLYSENARDEAARLRRRLRTGGTR